MANRAKMLNKFLRLQSIQNPQNRWKSRQQRENWRWKLVKF